MFGLPRSLILLLILIIGYKRDKQFEAGALTNDAGNFYAASMPVDNFLNYRQTEAGAAGLGGEEGREDLFQCLFRNAGAGVLDSVATRTGNWSYAYLNELRTTAAILAVGQGVAGVTPDILLQATTVLAGQFNAGRKNHAITAAGDVGFKVA